MEEDIFNSELGRKVLALVKASFKVSDLISDLVLREKIKHQVLNVYEKFLLTNLTRYDLVNMNKDLLKEIDILEHYFYLGGHLNFIKEEHLKQLQNGFLVFKSIIILLNNNTKEFPLGNSVSKNGEIGTRFQEVPYVGRRINSTIEKQSNVTARQKKILEKFEIKGTLKLAEISELFPDVSEKTIRNELTSLIRLGKITRSGKGNGSFYKKTIDS